MSCQLFPAWEAKWLQCKTSKYTCSKFKTLEISLDPLGWICHLRRKLDYFFFVFWLTL